MILIMLGAPGTGKGTVSGIISKELNLPQVSTGDIFRKNIANKTPLGLKVEDYLAKGQLVPDEIVIEIVENRLLDEDMKDGAILDGFPRTIKQAKALDEFLEKNDMDIKFAINLTTPEDELISRVVNRRVCPKCKSVYNLVLSPSKVDGICDKCGSSLIIRSDDNCDTFKQRLVQYFDQTSPLIDYYTNKDKIQNFVISTSINKMGKDVANELIEIIRKDEK